MVPDTPTEAWLRAIPKAELHLHIEGSLEPELMFALAARNQIELPYATVEQVRQAYEFDNLQSFLDIYYAGASVLVTEQDFFDLAWAYFERAHADSVIHAELMFDPQTHTARGIDIKIVIAGLTRAQAQAKQHWGISSGLIMCFLRHLSQEDAFETLALAKPYINSLIAVGLDSSEVGNPPEKFKEVFAECKKLGLHCVAHAGEEGPPSYIWGALDQLYVQRIDHGVRALEDASLMQRLVAERVPLTVCPLSNIKLKVFTELGQHNLKTMLEAGVCVTINADDPSYFGGYVGDNYVASASALSLTYDNIIQIARNSIEAAFITQIERNQMYQRFNLFLKVQPFEVTTSI